MKVYVMGGEQRDELSKRDEREWERFGEELPMREAFSAMTEIDIPDGCVLAVVDLEGKPVGEMLEIKSGTWESLWMSVSHYRRVIQEVKL